jgi:hypothetical protein
MEDEGSGAGILVIILAFAYFGGLFGGDKSSYDEEPITEQPAEYYPSELSSSTNSLEDNEESLSGSYTVEACNQDSGSCYELDADLDGSMVNTVYFPNGGNLDFDDGSCEGSYCYGTDEEGTEWEFTVE